MSATENVNSLHVIPLDDFREHLVSDFCWCNPTADDEDDDVMVHHSMDHREEYENGRLLS